MSSPTAEQSTPAASKPRGFGSTSRRDLWWVGPLATFLGLGAFVVYSTWAAFQGNHYKWPAIDPTYLSPFYSPEILLPDTWWKISPALLILWIPAGFRLTCYYYRKAYYRAFIADPVACAVGEHRQRYRGENAFPLLFQNLHRFFLYLAILILLVLWYDVWKALWYQGQFRIGVGTLVLALNSTLLSLYTFSCHSWRHLVGGNIDCFSCAKFGEARYKAWSVVSLWNRRHMLWAWTSLFVVGFSDVYVRLVSMGYWRDLTLIGPQI